MAKTSKIVKSLITVVVIAAIIGVSTWAIKKTLKKRSSTVTRTPASEGEPIRAGYEKPVEVNTGKLAEIKGGPIF